MADVHEPEVRSYNMSRIKGKNTKPEMLVRRFLHANGFRYRLHGKYKGKTLLGKPDIVLPKHEIVIFVHGCFWHGHEGCKYFVVPKTNTKFWLNKINRNKEKDEENTLKLQKMGWRVISVFECELKEGNAQYTLNQLVRILKSKCYGFRNQESQ